MSVTDTPVTRVYSDEFGIVCYERYGAEPIALGIDAPTSRAAAQERCDAIMRYCKRNKGLPRSARTEQYFRVCDHPHSITYDDLLTQTMEACAKSVSIERDKMKGISHGKNIEIR